VIAGGQIGAFLAGVARTAAWAHAAPLMGERAVAPRLRIAAAGLFALAATAARPPLPLAQLPSALPVELLLGLLFGFTSRLVLLGAEAAGQLVGLELQLGFAGSFDPMAREEALPTRRIAAALAGIAFLVSGGLEAHVRALSWHGAPTLDALDSLRTVALASGEVMVTALRAAAPLAIAGVVTHLALGFASRAAPALNVFSVSLACILVVGGLLLAATTPAFSGELLCAGRRAAQLLGAVR
jgi:flagellar biosynthetic protein FliR